MTRQERTNQELKAQLDVELVSWREQCRIANARIAVLESQLEQARERYLASWEDKDKELTVAKMKVAPLEEKIRTYENQMKTISTLAATLTAATSTISKW